MTRADAIDNHDRLLRAARHAFATDGLGIPLREIARRAEVAPATLYRHFPTKQALAEQAFADELRACQMIVHRACAAEDAWEGFCRLIEQLCEQHARSRGFTAAFLSAHPETVDLAAERRALLAPIAELIQRAQAAGKLRADVDVDDVVVMLAAHRGLTGRSPGTRDAASRRFIRLTQAAFQAHEAP